MKPNFKLENGNYSVSKFSSGEIQVTLTKDVGVLDNCTITGSVLSSDHIIELLQLVEVLRFEGTYYITLIMPYCAFSRQDRRGNQGEAFSLKVFADLINSCGFDSVITYDNHSYVSTALLHNCTNMPVHESSYLDSTDNFYDFYIGPNAGASKKVLECSKKFQVPMIRADKVRDTSTSEITHTEVFTTTEQLDGKTVLIIDDICAGGQTFIELAKVLKSIQPNVTIHLYVTHGFFQFGFEQLVEAGITQFITTDSVISPAYEANNFSHVTVIHL